MIKIGEICDSAVRGLDPFIQWKIYSFLWQVQEMAGFFFFRILRKRNTLDIKDATPNPSSTT